MMNAVLEQLTWDIRSMAACDKQLEFLDAKDKSGKTAIQIALEYALLFYSLSYST